MKKIDDILGNLDEQSRNDLARALFRRNYGKPKTDAEWFCELRYAQHQIEFGDPVFTIERNELFFKVTSDINGWVWFFQIEPDSDFTSLVKGNKKITLISVQHPLGWVWELNPDLNQHNIPLYRHMLSLQDTYRFLIGRHIENPWRSLWIRLIHEASENP